jgi:peptidyl-prolyl cis-trans isomerase D
MMAAFRAFYKSWAAKVLMGLLAVSFVAWGASTRGAFNVHLSDAVVKAGSREIDSADFKQHIDQMLQQYQQQTGQSVNLQDAVQQGVVQQTLEDMSTEESVLEAIRRAGVQASDQQVIDQLRKYPNFFNPVTGAFDEQVYETLLAQHNLTPAGFQRDLRDQLSLSSFDSGMAAGLKVPATYAVLFAALDQQSRAADYFLLDPRTQPQPAKPTDAQLNQFIKDHADRLRQPETRQITLVRISAQAIAAKLHPSDADVEKMFNIEKAGLSTPERRSFVKIQAKDQAQAQAIAARLAKGEAPAAVAASYGTKPITYDNEPQSAVDDQAVAKAVFALQAGQVSSPVQGQFGLAVAKLTSITPGKPATLDDVRPQIEKQLNDKASKDEAYDESEKYSDAHNKGLNMDAAVKASGAQEFKSPLPITAEGKLPNGQPIPSLNAKMVKDIFSLPQGGETDITDLGNGEYYAIRVDKVTPAHLPTLDEIRAPITQAYMTNEVIQAVKAKADALLARVKKGEALDAVAASAGAKVQHIELTRSTAQAQEQTLGQDFLAGVFEAKAGDTFDSPFPNYGYAVVKVDSVKPGSVQDIARESQTLRTQLSQEMARNEMTELLYAAARAEVKPHIDQDLAYQALGVQPPAAASSAPGKAPGKAP